MFNAPDQHPFPPPTPALPPSCTLLAFSDASLVHSRLGQEGAAVVLADLASEVGD
jgi:hypothetical protein